MIQASYFSYVNYFVVTQSPAVSSFYKESIEERLKWDIQICRESVQPQIGLQKFSRRRSRSPNYAEWSFQVVVSQRTAKKCTKIQNASAEL